MYNDSSNAGGRRRLATFAAAFAGAFVLGGVVLGVAYLELDSEPAATAPPAPPTPVRVLNDRHSLDAQFRQARARTADARRQADATEVAVFTFLNGRFVDSAEQATEPPSEPRRTPVGPTIRPNPEWIELNRQLAAMQQQRSELLEKLTPAHPTVQALDGQIAQAKDQLAAIPAELPTDPSEIASETLADRAPVSTSAPERQTGSSPPSPEMQRDYRNLLLAAGQARDAYRAAVEAETAEWNVCQQGDAPLIAMDRAGGSDLRPGGAGSQLPAVRVFPIGAITILTLLSLFAGVFAARRIEGGMLTFMSAEEIEATLGLPVLGRFASGMDRRSEDAA